LIIEREIYGNETRLLVVSGDGDGDGDGDVAVVVVVVSLLSAE